MDARARVVTAGKVRFTVLGLDGVVLAVLLLLHGLARQGVPVGALGVLLLLAPVALSHRRAGRSPEATVMSTLRPGPAGGRRVVLAGVHASEGGRP